jgi:hypothetical protein
MRRLFDNIDPLLSSHGHKPSRYRNVRRLAHRGYEIFPTRMFQILARFFTRIALKRQPSSAQAPPRHTAMREPDAGDQ